MPFPITRTRRIVAASFLSLAVLVTIFGAITAGFTTPPPRTSGSIAHDAYVWQRAWSDPVRAGVSRALDDYRTLILLAGEIDLSSPAAAARRVVVSLPREPLAGRQIAVAVRVTAFSGRFDDPAALGNLLQAVRDALAAAAEAGAAAGEVQLDFDAAEAQLGGYRHWLASLRPHLPPGVKLTITALPSWLDRPAFARLVRETDGFTLQVHGLERPASPDAPIALFDPANATRWIDRAARLRVPFRVALATYGYDLVFDSAGSLVAVLAEEATPDVPPGGTVRRVRSDPRAAAEFVRSLERSRPQVLEAIAWYRLPVEGERNNWSPRTLDHVRRGLVPIGRIEAAARRVEPRLVEIVLANGGNDEIDPPAVIEATAGSEVLAADGLGGYVWTRLPGQRVRFERQDGVPPIPPGGQRVIGWIRTAEDTEVRSDVHPPP
jgi:hypothetical protein